mgnify:FL=1
MLKIIKIIEEIFSDNGGTLNAEINLDTNLRDIGFSSFDLATLTVMIEDEFGVDIFEDGMINTVGEILEKLK